MGVAPIVKTSRGQAVIGLLVGMAFGFLLQKSTVTRYEVVLGQLLLRDFTVLKVMATAVIVASIGLFLLRRAGHVSRYVQKGAIGAQVVGGLIFGAGFALLGYCPGTVAGAAGQGSLDALTAGFAGLLCGVTIFAMAYPRIEATIRQRGGFPWMTLEELLHIPEWTAVCLLVAGMAAVLALLGMAGF